MRTVDRRTFLKGMAAASAVTPHVLLGDTGEAEEAPEVEWTKAPCRLCGVGCGLVVAIEGGRAAAVRGDPDSPVGQGLACAKGYYSVQSFYAHDRIAHALIRRSGKLVEAPIGEALDLVAQRMRETITQHGKDGVALYGSAQWTVPDAYVASKLFKGALGTNNIESSARLYAASAMAGLETTFGLDGSLGCYEDIDHADVFVLWDANIAESDPVLFSRMLARRRADPAVRIIDLATRTTRTSYAADYSTLHAPHSALAVANAVCQEIVARKWADREFVDRYVAFKRGKTGIGYGLSGDALVVDDAIPATWDEYAAFLSAQTPERAQDISGMPASSIRWVASLYGDRSRKVMSIWAANANQHARGTWMNNVLYNIHLLVGKIASPGNSAFCITGQPNGGCSVHDAGTLTHTLPRGVVANADDRRRAANIWGVPETRIDPRPTHTALSMFRALERGDIRFLWIQATNPMLSLPNLNRYRHAAAQADRFIVVSEVYPTATTAVADVVLPAALWMEREGVYANVERRVQHFEQSVTPPGDAASDAWHMIEVARRLGFANLFPWERQRHASQIWDEYRRFHDDSRSALPPFSVLRSRPGAQWPFVNGRETHWRYNTAYDPAADRGRGTFDFYGHSDGRAWIWLRPYEAPADSPNREHPFWLTTGPVLEHWGGGAITQRIPTLHHAAPRAYVEMNGADAERLGIQNGETVRLINQRGSLKIEARINYRAQPAPGHVFVPSFDETLPVKELLLDASCPLSGQPDLTRCAVRVERLAVEGGK